MADRKFSSNGKTYPTMKIAGNLLMKYRLFFLNLTFDDKVHLKGGGVVIDGERCMLRDILGRVKEFVS